MMLLIPLHSFANERMDACVDIVYAGAQGINSEAKMNSQVLQIAENTNWQELYGCGLNTIEITLPMRTSYLLFGDVIKTVVSTAKAVLPYGDTINTDFTPMEINRTALSQLEVVFKAITVIIFVITIISLSYIYTILLYRSSKDGEFLGKKQEKLWTILKFLIGMTLLMPVQWLSGYSLAQMLMMLAAVLGTIMASIIWLFFSIIINVILFINPQAIINDNEAIYEEKASVQIQKIVNVHLNDLMLREYILEQYADPTFNLLSNYSKTEFAKCLFNEEYNFNQNDYYYQSPEIKTTIECYRELGRQNRFDVLHSDNIQSIISNEANMNGAMFHSDSKTDFVLNEANMEYLSQQARQIALKKKQYICSDTDIQGMYSARNYKYGYICGVTNVSGDYQFNGQRLTYFNELSESARNALSQEIKEDIDSLVEYSKNQSMANISNMDNDFLDDAKIVVKRAMMNGWYGANSFLMDSANAVYLLNNTIMQKWNSFEIKENDIVLTGVVARNNSNSIVVKIDSKKNNVINTFEKEIKAELTDNKLVINTYLRPLYKMNRLIGSGNSSSAEMVRDEELCLDEFENCNEGSINPVYDMVRMGNDMVVTGLTMGLGMAGVETIVESCYKKAARGNNCFRNNIITGNVYLMFGLKEVIQMASMVNIIYVLMGLLFSFLIPIIPYIFFIGAIISLFIKFIEAVVTAQIWAFMFFLPSDKEREDFQNVKPGFMLMMTLFIQPSLIVLAMMLIFITLSIFIGILNILIAIVINMLPISLLEGFSFVSMTLNIAIYLIYLVAIILFVVKISKELSGIVDNLGNIIDLESVKTYDQLSQSLSGEATKNTEKGINRAIGLRQKWLRFLKF
jgi:conjugal transfer/type IV secretion protein DotA/TraY